VPVGNEKKTFVLVLQFDPIFQRAMEIAQMQLPGGAHAGKDAPILQCAAHAAGPIQMALMT
jgi:hypothetical protein